MFRQALIGLAALMCLAAPQFAAAETRMALVIGNSTYQHMPARRTAVDDAKAIGAMLSSAGFAVTSASNVADAEMRRHVREFAAAVAASGPDTVALMFFAGQGMQIDGENYLVPVDGRPEKHSDVSAQTLTLTELLSTLTPSERRMLIVMLDTSRANPFSSLSRSGKGLAIVDALPASIIGHATSPGQGLVESDGPHSFYTTAILEAMKEPGLQIEQMFKKVRVRVNALSGGHQVTWETASLTRNFSFFPR